VRDLIQRVSRRALRRPHVFGLASVGCARAVSVPDIHVNTLREAGVSKRSDQKVPHGVKTADVI
jgi:hypothetical protein